MSSSTEPSPRSKGRLLRRLVLLGVVVVVVLLVLVVLAPTIAAPIAKPMVQDAVNRQIKGEAEVTSLKLGWLGGQKAELTLDDPEGGRVADVSVRVDTGLLGLAFGSRDLGVVFVSGEADIVRDADGVTNLQRAIEPRIVKAPDATPSGGEPVTLPSSLAASVVLDGLKVTYTDAALAAQTNGQIGSVRLGALTGSVDFAVGKPAAVVVKGPIATGVDVAGLAESGSIDLRVDVTNLIDTSGTLTVDKAIADLTLALTAPAIDAAVEAKYSDGKIERTGPTRVTVDSATLATLVPSVAEALTAQPGVTISELPDLTLNVDRLSFPLSGGVGGLSAAANIKTTQTTGTVELPTGQTTKAAAFAIEPLTLAVDVPSLSQTVTITGGTRATIDGDSAGEVSVDLAVGGLADANGTLRGGIPEEITGGLRVEGFSTPILQPFVAAVASALPEGLRIDLPNDIGPTLDLALSATSHTDTSGAYDIDLVLNAAKAELDAAVVVEGQQISTRGEGVRGRFATVAPIVDRFVAAYGVRVHKGAAVTFNASDLEIDLAKIKGDTGLDLRGVRAKADIEVSDAAGQMQFAGDDALRDYRLDRLMLGIATDDFDKEVVIVGDMTAQLEGKPLATSKIDMTLAGLLDEAGAPATESLPSLRGEVRVENIAFDTIDTVFGPLYRERGLVLTRDIGPKGDLVLLAASNPQVGGDATNLDLTFRSKSVDIAAPLLVQRDRLRSRESVTIVDRSLGGTVASVLGEAGPAQVQPGGALRLVVSGLDVPIGAGAIRPDRIAGTATLTMTEFAADVGLAGPDGKIAQRQRIEVPSLRASVVAAAGAAPSIELDGKFRHADQAFTLTGNSTLHGLFLEAPADEADSMSVVSLGTVMPESSFELKGVPATLARLVPRDMVKVGDKPLDVVLLTRDGLGRTFDVLATTSENKGRSDTTNYTVDLISEATQVRVSGRRRWNMVSLDRGRGSIGVTPRVAAHLASVVAPDVPVMPRLTENANIGFVLHEPFVVPLTSESAPDFAAADTFDATVTLDAALAALTLPAGEGADAADPMTIPPVRVKGLAVHLVAPGAIMTAAGGTVQATLDGGVLAADGTSIVDVKGSVSSKIKDAAPVGEAPVSLTLSQIDGAWIDTLLGKPALVAGSVGERFDVTLDANPREIIDGVRGGTPIRLNITGPRFSTEEPIGIAMNKDAVFLQNELKASWLMGPRWANLYFLGDTPGGEAPAFSFTEQTRVYLDVRRLALAYGEGAAPLKPGVFIANLTATVPDLAAKLSDGRDMRVGGLEARIGRGPTPDQIGLSVKLPRMKIGDQAEVAPEKSEITGRLASFTDENGNLTPETARLTLEGGFAPIPTAVIDAFAKQNGLLVDVLGPVVDFGVDADEFGMTGGKLVATATAPFARAEIRGAVQDGLFVIDKTSVVEATRITTQATKRLQKALPLLASLEKTQDDRPAKIVFDTPIAVPMDGNFDRLNGKFTVDIGTARFGTADLFQRVLAVAQQKTAGEVGRRLPPLKITMADGLVSYEPYPLPLGEFTIETQGFINLSSKSRRIKEGSGNTQLPAGQLEVLTFIPAGAFAAEAVPGIADIPLPLVGNIAKLPIRTSGLIASPKNDIAVDLVGKNAVNTLLSPDKLLRDGAGGLLEDILGGGRNRNKDE